MADVFDVEHRSRIMRAVKSVDTKPEMIVRRTAHAMGFRYRLHRRDLPGSPDIVFPSQKKAIFVHGCFWHGHCCRRGNRTPKTNRQYWKRKISRNVERDKKNIKELEAVGLEVLVIWECEIKFTESLVERLRSFLSVP